MEAEAAVPQLQAKGEKLSKQLVLEEQVRSSYSESFGLSVMRPKPCLKCDAQVPLELQSVLGAVLRLMLLSLHGSVCLCHFRGHAELGHDQRIVALTLDLSRCVT